MSLIERANYWMEINYIHTGMIGHTFNLIRDLRDEIIKLQSKVDNMKGTSDE